MSLRTYRRKNFLFWLTSENVEYISNVEENTRDMNQKTKIDKINQGLKMLYTEAESVFPRKIQWEELNTEEVAKIMDGNPFLWNSFYIPEKRFDEVVMSLTKHCPWSWRWPRKTKIDEITGEIVPDPEWDEYKAAWDIMQEKFERKEITHKEYSKWLDAMGKKYGMIHRNYDREAIKFNIWNVGPSTNKEQFERIKAAYQMWTIQGIDLDLAVDHCYDMKTYLDEYSFRKEIVKNCEEKDDDKYLSQEEIMKEVNRWNKDHHEQLKELVIKLKKIWDEVLQKNK